LAIAAWPTTPLPPERLTTLTGTPSFFSRPAAKIRAEMSVPPPASQGTMIWIGRSG